MSPREPYWGCQQQYVPRGSGDSSPPVRWKPGARGCGSIGRANWKSTSPTEAIGKPAADGTCLPRLPGDPGRGGLMYLTAGDSTLMLYYTLGGQFAAWLPHFADAEHVAAEPNKQLLSSACQDARPCEHRRQMELRDAQELVRWKWQHQSISAHHCARWSPTIARPVGARNHRPRPAPSSSSTALGPAHGPGRPAHFAGSRRGGSAGRQGKPGASGPSDATHRLPHWERPSDFGLGQRAALAGRGTGQPAGETAMRRSSWSRMQMDGRAGRASAEHSGTVAPFGFEAVIAFVFKLGYSCSAGWPTTPQEGKTALSRQLVGGGNP